MITTIRMLSPSHLEADAMKRFAALELGDRQFFANLGWVVCIKP